MLCCSTVNLNEDLVNCTNINIRLFVKYLSQQIAVCINHVPAAPASVRTTHRSFLANGWEPITCQWVTSLFGLVFR